ncbi:MAG: hypothetical protein N3A38_10860, partial [Planctomycetota bacterium]|nr:hypothetical protein [Planctomycetota bacterium]
MRIISGLAALSAILFVAQAVMSEGYAGDHGGGRGGGRGGRSGRGGWRPVAPPVNPGGGDAPAAPGGEKREVGEAEKPTQAQEAGKGRA